jgi:hypothetical protein
MHHTPCKYYVCSILVPTCFYFHEVKILDFITDWGTEGWKMSSHKNALDDKYSEINYAVATNVCLFIINDTFLTASKTRRLMLHWILWRCGFIRCTPSPDRPWLRDSPICLYCNVRFLKFFFHTYQWRILILRRTVRKCDSIKSLNSGTAVLRYLLLLELYRCCVT